MKMIAGSLGLGAISETVFIHFFVGCLVILAVMGLALFFCSNLVGSYKK